MLNHVPLNYAPLNYPYSFEVVDAGIKKTFKAVYHQSQLEHVYTPAVKVRVKARVVRG